MGCASSAVKPEHESSDVEEDAVTDSSEVIPKWRRVLSSDDARKKYEADGTLPLKAPSYLLELRGFLDDPMLMKHIGMFGKNRKSFDAFMCWVDIQEFKSIGSGADDYCRSKALHIYQKYLKEGAMLKLANVQDSEIENVYNALLNAKKNKTDISINVFDGIQQQCLEDVYTDIFKPFKYSENYNEIMHSMNRGYNRTKPDDFEFIEVLGQGGFGIVVHCKKKSTGKHYALKIQTKMGLLTMYKNVLHRVDFEKQALAACNHPFIVALDYAFQMDTTVFLAMQLGTAGTLHDAALACPKSIMSEERVKFYAAEIVLALAHIHGLGMIYRDLKPQNVLLNADGHIQLVDLGGIIDPGGHVLGIQDESDDMMNGLFVKDYAHFSEQYVERHQREKSKSSKATALPRIVDSGELGESKLNSNSRSISSSSQVNGSAPRNQRSAPTSEVESPTLPSAPNIHRARSIMGTDGYMAVEIMMLKAQKNNQREGYTNAVDWWSLGVMMFVLLTGEKPFPNLTFGDVPRLMELLEKDEKYKNGTQALLEMITCKEELPIEYLQLTERLLNTKCVSPDALHVILRFLDFNEVTRLGSAMSGGVKKIKEHPLFRWEVVSIIGSKSGTVSYHVQEGDSSFGTTSALADKLFADQSSVLPLGSSSSPVEASMADVETSSTDKKMEYCWDKLELKQMIPPFKPEAESLAETVGYESFESFMIGMDKGSWLKQHPSSYYDEYFQNWNFISPHILKMEYGLANEMEQYETKYKARQLLGHVEADSKKNKMSKKGSIVGTSYFSKMVSGFQ